MSKSSIVNVREAPLPELASVRARAVTIQSETLVVETDERIDLVDLTPRVTEYVRACGVKEGVVHIWSMHTTCAVFINEFQRALLDDIKVVLEKLVGRDDEWTHNDPAHSDCDRMNADAHLRAMLLGHSLSLQVSGGELVLGQWQRILIGELDGPRARSLRVQVWGIG
jgi:secondary thiamine-phosphate synthase enzyme